MNYSFEKFRKQVIIRFLSLDKYNYLRNEVYNYDVSKDKNFQKTFNSFYRVRRNEKWRIKFYSYFEKIKNNPEISFDIVVKDLLLETGYLEASFSSKLLATINTNMPIWDQYVLNNLGFKVSGSTKQERLDSVIEIYGKIIEQEKKLLEREDIKKSVDKMREEFNEYDLSEIKALDYILWNSRKEDENE